MANPVGMFFATVTAAISDFVLEVFFKKGEGDKGDLGLYTAGETKDGLKPELLVVRLENKSRVLTVIIILPKNRKSDRISQISGASQSFPVT